jgi:hypothetical protein
MWPTCCLCVICAALAGCRGAAARPDSARPVPEGLSPPIAIADLDALCVPPLHWHPEPLKTSNQHRHQVWVSPSGSTAYGVIWFALPLPVGEDAALWGFLREMKRTEGEATLHAKQRDPQTDALRFVAEGGQYLIRGSLVTRGFHGWAVYAGTLRNRPISQEELELAVRARENTALGLPADATDETPPDRSPADDETAGTVSAGTASRIQPAGPHN